VAEYLRVFCHVGFFCFRSRYRGGNHLKMDSMDTTKPTIATMAQQVAQAAKALQLQRTGHAPKAVTVVLSEDTLVVTLLGALTPAEHALAKSREGAAKVQEFHRQLFRNSLDSLWKDIKKITGREVREAAAEIDPNTGSVVHAFTTGTMVQVFLLAENVLAESASERGAGVQS
jgi:uncharacterized protein YbcI